MKATRNDFLSTIVAKIIMVNIKYIEQRKR
jgi:hypothetical protein